MRVFVKAKPSAKEEAVERVDDSNFVVSVKEPPVRGLANQAIIKALSNFFGVPVSAVKMIAGYASRQKIFEITKNE